MVGVLSGFGVICVIVAIGWLLARTGTLGDGGLEVVNRLVFFVATPALLVDSLARTPLREVVSPLFAVCALSATVVALLYRLLAGRILRASGPDLTIGALSASYTNSVNLGLPIALYVLGDLGYVVPLLLFQVGVMQPVAITLLEPRSADGGRRAAALSAVRQAVRTPLVGAAVVGLVVSALPWTPPEKVTAPLHLIGQMSVPGALLVFGMSLYGVRVLEAGASPRREIALASVLKLVAHPLVAWALAYGLFGMRGHLLLTSVVGAALPTAQNVLVLATRYGRGELLARDAAVLTTAASLPVLVLVAWLLG